MTDRLKFTLYGVAIVLEGYWAILPPITQSLPWIMAADLALMILAMIRAKSISRELIFRRVTELVSALILLGVAVVLNPHVQPALGIDLVLSSSFGYMVYLLTSISHSAAILNVPMFNQAEKILSYFQAISGEKSEKKSES